MNCEFCQIALAGRQKKVCPACRVVRQKDYRQRLKIKHGASVSTVTYSQLVDIFRNNGMLYSVR